MALNSIEHEWRRFVAMAFPGVHPGSDQYRALKATFYAGVTVLRCQLHEIGQPHISEEEAEHHLWQVQLECDAFARQAAEAVQDEVANDRGNPNGR